MLALAEAGAGEGLWLRAECQSAGRGRQGRAWVSVTGNLYASTLVRLRGGDPPAPTLALVSAVALEEAISIFRRPGEGRGRQVIESLSDPQGGPGLRRGDVLAIKWPNDLLLGGAKLAGILLERSNDAVVIGFGVNCAHHPDLPDRPTTSLAEHDCPVDPAILVETLAEIFARWLEIWRGQGIAAVRSRWLGRAHPIGTALTARPADGQAIEGLFAGLNDDGALRLRLADGSVRVIHAADVFLL